MLFTAEGNTMTFPLLRYATARPRAARGSGPGRGPALRAFRFASRLAGVSRRGARLRNDGRRIADRARVCMSH